MTELHCIIATSLKWFSVECPKQLISEMMNIKQFSIECRKTKTKAITQPITTDRKSAMSQSEFEAITHNWCKVPRDWFWFYFSLVEKVARVSLSNHRAKQ